MRSGSSAWWGAFVALVALLGAVTFAVSLPAMVVGLSLAALGVLWAILTRGESGIAPDEEDGDDASLDVGEFAEVPPDADEAICLFCGRGYPAAFAYCPECRRTPSVYDT